MRTTKLGGPDDDKVDHDCHVAMTSDNAATVEQLPREEWQRIPHEYVCAYPKYPCANCGLWPGAQIHQAAAKP